MKFVWLPLTAALLATGTIAFAEKNKQPHLADKDLSPKEVNEIYADLDQDKVPTKNDQCQNTELFGAVNSIGCDLDSDQDGIYDKSDQCPNTTEGIAVNFLGCAADTDYDSVVDSQDHCPLTPLGTKIDLNGCKIIDDSDHDGVTDNIDQCLDTPLEVEVNQFGCQPRTSLLINIVFDTASYNIRSDQEHYLAKDLNTLKDLQEGEVILIVGHTDNIGSISDNISLSWNRTESVKQYLMAHSEVDFSKIYLIGQGESSPIADNSTSVGRQENRRIELEVMTQEALPQSAILETRK
ncbi:OmpA family protein [Marinomonas sp. 5E14-1]|uniref:OmpA family protein n=1 Tax=Marinomonas sp. 5E14-1 TaxID=3153922 RepID=UPI00326309A3